MLGERLVEGWARSTPRRGLWRQPASLHALAALEQAEYFEYCVQTTELNQRLVAEKFPVTDGYVAVPQRPGLGVQIDEEVLEQCRVK